MILEGFLKILERFWTDVGRFKKKMEDLLQSAPVPLPLCPFPFPLCPFLSFIPFPFVLSPSPFPSFPFVLSPFPLSFSSFPFPFFDHDLTRDHLHMSRYHHPSHFSCCCHDCVFLHSCHLHHSYCGEEGVLLGLTTETLASHPYSSLFVFLALHPHLHHHLSKL